MRYTTDKPTEPGFYFYREGGDVYVIHVRAAGGALRCTATGWESNEPLPLADVDGGEWAGPIPEPHA